MTNVTVPLGLWCRALVWAQGREHDATATFHALRRHRMPHIEAAAAMGLACVDLDLVRSGFAKAVSDYPPVNDPHWIP